MPENQGSFLIVRSPAHFTSFLHVVFDNPSGILVHEEFSEEIDSMIYRYDTSFIWIIS